MNNEASLGEIKNIIKNSNTKVKLPFINIQGKEKEYDIGELNKHFRAAQDKNVLNGFGFIGHGRKIYVDLETGKISVNKSKVNLDIPNDLKKAIETGNAKLRYIHFKRHIVSKRIGGKKETHHIIIAAGWQTNYNEKNYQRFILLYPDGRIELHKKR